MKTLSNIINSINNDVKGYIGLYIGLSIAMFSICGLAFAFQLSQLAAVLRLAVPVLLCLPPSRLDDPDDLDDLLYDVPSACWMLLSFMVGVAAFAVAGAAIAYSLYALLCAILG